ncbi:metallophosphoesterase family protein [Wenzhouxiangella sp. EGI_FJ10305]|uniref:metallophosphoesterase family protein n=1 Tax=Wenzhouxiangella sp. EGI_FJ10305 TaxID=3243768 RepID=UPI0035D8B421
MTLMRNATLAVALMSSLFIAACTPAESDREDDIALRFAVLGDAEPKPEPQFPNMAAAIDHVNRMADSMHIDFVVGVGDIAHKGTVVQYENATAELRRLALPFYPIMGNEEHGSTVERYLKYANRWGRGGQELTEPSYVVETEEVALVLASPDSGRDFDDRGIEWMLERIKALQPKPVLLIVHGAQAGVYPENPDKGIHHEGFAEVVAQPNLAAVISGDLHMDMDRVEHSKEIDGVHYLHIPPLERTKIPDESRHTAMLRVFTLDTDGEVLVETYEVGVEQALARHEYRFEIEAR